MFLVVLESVALIHTTFANLASFLCSDAARLKRLGAVNGP